MAYVKRRAITANVTDHVIKYYTHKRYCVSKEIGLCKRGRLRADFLALNTKREIIIVEVKSCVQDFRTDKKWHKYLPYCNKLYFALTEDTWRAIQSEIPKGIGVMILNDYGLTIVQSAKRRTVDLDHQLEILTRLAFRQADYNRYKYVHKIKNIGS